MKIAILGARGHVGKACVEYFVSQGDKVTAYGSSSKPDFDHQLTQNQTIDYFNQEDLNKVWKSHDGVLITTAVKYNLKEWQLKWPDFASNCAKAILQSETKTIFFDNVYAYGLVNGEMVETSLMNPTSKKGQVRKQVDEIFLELIEQGKQVVIAKSADFYGPGVATSVMSERFHKLVSEKNTFEWLGDASKAHSFTYLPDIPPALWELMHSSSVGVYHLPTSHQNMSGLAIKQILERHTGKKLKVSQISKFYARILRIIIPPLRELIEMMYQFEEDYRFNSDKIQKEFPHLKVTPLEEGIKSQYESYTS